MGGQTGLRGMGGQTGGGLGGQPGLSPFCLDLLCFALREGRERIPGGQPGLGTIARYLKLQSKNPLSKA